MPLPDHPIPHRVHAETIARRYQLDFTEKAKQGNIIVCLATGCGKTLIAVLLLNALSDSFSSPQLSISVFLVPTVNLVQQQGCAIESCSDLKVKQYVGEVDRGRWSLQQWEDDIRNFEVLVMTPQILLNMLRHSLIRLEAIKVLIFDECHHCQKGHPYARIMEEHYFAADVSTRPRVLGMTASPIIRKGNSELKSVQDITSLERLLDAKIHSVKDTAEIEAVAPRSKIEFMEYDQTFYACDRLQLHTQALHQLRMKHLRQSAGSSEGIDDVWMAANQNLWKKKHAMFAKICRDLEYCLYELGVWCARHAAEIYLSNDKDDLGQSLEERSESIPITEKDFFLRDFCQYLNESLAEGPENLNKDGLKSDLVSDKVATLVSVLSNFRDPQLKCIVFVERVIAAKVLASFLCHSLGWLQCKFLVGSNSGMSSSKTALRKTLDDFRSRSLNVLVATNVAEEGLDIQDCFLVIRFDLPKTLRSFIQSRGRARLEKSYYIVMIERGNVLQQEMLESLMESEDFVQNQISHWHDVSVEQNSNEYHEMEEFKVERTGASVNLNYSVALLHHYCSKLPGDEFYDPAPTFSYIPESEGIKCEILLPSNAPIRCVVGEICESKALAKRVACLKACKSLYYAGALTDHLLPQTSTSGDEDEAHYPPRSSKDTSTGCDAELQETIIPSPFLRQKRNNSSVLSLQSYRLCFIPTPDDRKYKCFALVLQSHLPKDAANICLELQLANRRTVSCQLNSSGEVFFTPLQVTQAEKFQSLLFSVLLDHEVTYPDLTKWFSVYSGWYLLLPIVTPLESMTNHELKIDWETINKGLRSEDTDHASDMPTATCSSLTGALHFANEHIDIREVPGSLIETIYRKKFYCVIDIFSDLNGNSPFPNSSHHSYSDYFKNIYDLKMSHRDQPLLKVKPLRLAHNLLVDRSSKKTAESRASEETLVELPPEFCHMRALGLCDGLINAAALLPSFMHRLESILMAIQLRDVLSTRFLEGSHVSVLKVLEALTTQNCGEPFSLERLELLGDSFLKYAISCHLFLVHDTADEGVLDSKRKGRINNSFLYILGRELGLLGYIRDTFFRPADWVAPCHPSKVICDNSNIADLHGQFSESKERGYINCNKRHWWMHRKTVADVVEALIGAYLVDGGQDAALAFMRCMGLEVDITLGLVSNIHSTTQNNLSLLTRFDIEAVEKLLSYSFKHKGLLIEAFTHASFTKHLGQCYQRLEFLGDSVLDYLITRYFYEKFSHLNPGQLTDLRSASVNNENFARVAVQQKLYLHLIENSVDLSQHINKFVSNIHDSLTSANEIFCDWSGDKCPKVLGDLVESLAGAVIVDSRFDLDTIWKVFEPMLKLDITIQNSQLPPVRKLQELCQRNRFKLTFEPHHIDSGFEIKAKVHINNEVIEGAALAKDKTSAKRQAAHDLLYKLEELGYVHDYNFLGSHGSSNKENPIETNEFNDTSAVQMQVESEDLRSEDNSFGDTPCTGMLNLSECLTSADPILPDTSILVAGICNNVNHQKENDNDINIKCNQEKDKPLYTSEGYHYEVSHCKEKCIPVWEISEAECFDMEMETLDESTTFTFLHEVPLTKSMASASTKTGHCEKPRLQNHKEPTELERLLHHFKDVYLKPTQLHTESDTMDSNIRKIKPESSPSETTEGQITTYYSHAAHVTSRGPQQGRSEVISSEPVELLTEMPNAIQEHGDTSELEDGKAKSMHCNMSSFLEATIMKGSQDGHCGTQSQLILNCSQGLARSKLYEACAQKRWRDPTFICCMEDGMDHNKMFTYDVIMQLPGVGQVECSGDPKKSKKLAMDSAAGELLRWLESVGYL